MAQLAVISQDFSSLPELQNQGSTPVNFKSVPPLVIAQYTLGPVTADMQSLNYTYGFLRKISLNETRVGNLKITKTSSFADNTGEVSLPSAFLDMDGNRIINLGDADTGSASPNNQGIPHHGVNLRVGDQRYLRKEARASDQDRTMSGDLIFNNNLAIKTNNASGILTITSSTTPDSNNAKIILNSGEGIVSVAANNSLNVNSTTNFAKSVNFTTGDVNSLDRRIQNLRRLNDGSEYTSDTYDSDPITIGDVKVYVFVPGMIIMWAGPVEDNFDETGLGINTLKGWALCNGTTHTINTTEKLTPDLRDKFIIGADSYSDSKWQTKVTGVLSLSGGSKNAIIVSHNHSVTNSGAHGHTITDPGHAHSYSLAAGTVGGTGHAGRTVNVPANTTSSTTGIVINEGGAHSHTVSTEGESGLDKNLPPFYALAYIIRL